MHFFFFSFPLLGESRWWEGYKAERETGRVWKLLPLVRSMAGAHNGPSPFIFSTAECTLRGREMEGGKPESMLETCAVVPDPPCRCCTDSTGSVWVREAVGTHKDDLFTNLSK